MNLPAALAEAIDAFRPRVEQYRDGRTARGMCWSAAEQFAAFLNERRAAAARPYGGWAKDLLGHTLPTEWWQDSSHVVCVVRVDGRQFIVDWTAAQYGREEFPLVDEVDELPKENPWLLTPEEAKRELAKAAAALDETGS